MSQHKVFISYHHANDRWYKDALLSLNQLFGIFVDASVDTGDISDDLMNETVRQIIRDDYLRDSTVTIVLVGTETKRRKHVDWEIYSSMYDGAVNKKSGILIINLPNINCGYFHAPHGNEEKLIVYPSISQWTSITSRSEYESRYPYMPDRIIDNLLNDVKISVTDWATVTADPGKLRLLIDLAYRNRDSCNYDLSRPMRRANS